MAAATLISRVLGMVREMVYASFMGTSATADAFTLAFKIPNLFRRLLGEGALTAAFIPIFKDKEANTGVAEMWRAANAVISGLLVAGSAVCAVSMIGITIALPLLEPKIVPSSPPVHSAQTGVVSTGAVQVASALAASAEPVLEGGMIDPSTGLMLRLLRIMFPYLLLVCMAAIFIGILNARGHFFIPALGAVALNVVMILVVWLLVPFFGTELPHQIFALAWGVLIAGAAQMACQLPTLLREGFKPRWIAPWKEPVVREVVIKMIPGTIGVASFQINVLVTDLLAMGVGDGLVASFGNAVRLMELPQGVFGISLATYLLPTLSGLAAEKKFPEFRKTVAEGVSHLVFVNVLATVFLVLLAEPIVRLLFERGRFDAVSTAMASSALAALGPGLIAFSLVNILARAFYALGDTRTPMRISIFCLVVNLAFTAALIIPFRQVGMGVANSASALLNVVLLTIALKKKLGRLDWSGVRQPLVHIVTAGAAAGLVAWLLMKFSEHRFGTAGLWPRAAAVFLPMAVATAVYFGISTLLHVPAAKEVVALVLGRFRKKAG